MVNINRYNPHKQKHFGVLATFLRVLRGPAAKKFENCCSILCYFPGVWRGCLIVPRAHRYSQVAGLPVQCSFHQSGKPRSLGIRCFPSCPQPLLAGDSLV